MNSIRLYIDLLSEAAYDNMVASMKLKFPDAAQAIDQFVKWCKAALVKSDRITWMLRIYSAELSGNQQLLKSLLGTFEGTTQDVATQITHYFGFNVPAITNYQFLKQPVSQVIDDFEQLKDSHESKVNREKPVTPKEKDKVLFEFSNGTRWWFVDRGYCPEEGRSGNHCGNVMGKSDKTQRILSYRTPEGHVLLTFILLANGTLGEMKAKGNQKPAAKYHPYIMPLLLWDQITGIAPTDRQYAPDLNFNVFDLNDQHLKEIDAKKPVLIKSQIKSRPVTALKSPDWLKNKYREVIKEIAPAIDSILFSSNKPAWETAISTDSSLIIYAPTTLKNFKTRVADEFVKNPWAIIQAPSYLRNDYEILKKTIKIKPGRIGYIPETTEHYSELCNLAVHQSANAIEYVPDQYKTPDLCKVAVKKNPFLLRHVPVSLITPDLVKIAIRQNLSAISVVPSKHRSYEICKFIVKKSGDLLRYVPKKLQTPELCKIAIQQVGGSIGYIPSDRRTPELCKIAVQGDGNAIQYVPPNLQTPELFKIAVQQNGHSLYFIPTELKTLDLCKLAVQQNGTSLSFVPNELKTLEICKIAVEDNPYMISNVPLHIRPQLEKTITSEELERIKQLIR